MSSNLTEPEFGIFKRISYSMQQKELLKIIFILILFYLYYFQLF